MRTLIGRAQVRDANAMHHRSPEIERNDSRLTFRDAVRSLPASSSPTPLTPGLYLAQRDQTVPSTPFPRDATTQ